MYIDVYVRVCGLVKNANARARRASERARGEWRVATDGRIIFDVRPPRRARFSLIRFKH